MRQRQLGEKMEDNRRRQQESIESREELLRELEQVQQLTAREKAEEERKRREREEEMQAQVRYVLCLIFERQVAPFPQKRARTKRNVCCALSSLLHTRELFSYRAPPLQLSLCIRAYSLTFCRPLFSNSQITSRREKAKEQEQLKREEMERER